MDTAHKKNLSKGRGQAAAVRRYLGTLHVTNGTKGRRPSKAVLERRLADIETTLQTETDPVRKLELFQAEIDTRANLERLAADATKSNGTDPEKARKEFVKIGAEFASRRHLSYAAFRRLGVPARVLQDAGISRRTS